MLHIAQRKAVLVGAAALLLAALATLPPLRQDPRYHTFADRRTLLGIPNFWNVISNLPFFLAAACGVSALRSRPFVERWERAAHWALLAGAVGVGAGSSYYHLHPDNQRLFYDRLPTTVVFMAMAAITLGECVSRKAAKRALLPLLAAGVASVFIWRATGDLRLYAAVQFGAMLAMPLMLIFGPGRDPAAAYTWGAVLLYGAAKIAEALDRQMGAFLSTGGHPWKHVAAGAALVVYVVGIGRRSALARAPAREASAVVLRA